MAGELRTPLCSMLGIELPILSAGFGAGAGAELAAAVSGAGGLGVVGAAGGMPADFAQSECARARRLTDAPFGINLIVAEDPGASDEERAEDLEYFRSVIAAAGRGGASAVVLFWGDPEPFVGAARELGLKLLMQVGSLEEAEQPSRPVSTR